MAPFNDIPRACNYATLPENAGRAVGKLRFAYASIGKWTQASQFLRNNAFIGRDTWFRPWSTSLSDENPTINLAYFRIVALIRVIVCYVLILMKLGTVQDTCLKEYSRWIFCIDCRYYLGGENTSGHLEFFVRICKNLYFAARCTFVS